VWEEEAAQAAASFRFQNKSRPLNECVHATSSLLLYPPEHVFAGGSLYMAWQPELIKRSLDHLTPARSRVRLVAKALADKCTAEEPWYGTRYGQVPLSDAQIASYTAAAEAYARLVAQRSAGGGGSGGSAAAAGAAAKGDDAWAASLTPALALPAPNEFIPTDFTLRHPELASKQAEAESTVGASLGGDAEEEGEGEGDSDESDGGDAHEEEEEAAEGAADAGDATSAAAAAPKSLLPPRRRREPVPALLRDDARATVWFRQDDRFAQPKTYFKAEITLPAAYATPRANVLTDLFNRLLTESLNEFAYAADIAGLRYSTSVSARGLAMGAGGFSHKLATLVAKVAERMADLSFSDAQFAIYKDKATRDLENWAVEQPLQHALYATNIALIAPLWHNDAKLAAVRTVTAEELRAFQRVLLAQSHVRCLVVGNATGEEAVGVADALLRPLTAVSGEVAPAQHVAQRCAKLPAPLVLLPVAPSAAGSVLSSIAAAVLHPQGGRGAASGGREGTALVWELRHSQVSRNGEDPNSAMEYVFQIGPTSVGPLATQAALFRLALHLLAEPFFDSLRTKQQLGYIVNAGFRQDSGVRALRLLIQSNKVSGAELVRRTDAFLATTFPAFLAAMSPAKYAQNVGAVIAQANEDDKSLAEESNGLWAEIADGRLDFERARHVTDALVGLSQAAFLAWYHEHMSPGGARRRVFVSVVEPVSPAAPSGAAAAVDAANDAAAPADVHAEASVVAAAAAAAGSDTAAAAADGDAAAAAAALAQQGEVPASPVAGEAVPAEVAASAGGGLARTDAVGTPVAGDAAAAAAAGGQDEEAGAAAAAERFAASETVAHLTLAQAAVVQQALAAAGLEGGRIAAADAPLVTACFAEAGVSISGFAERAARSPAPAGAQHPYVRCLVSVAHPENVKAVLPMYAPLGTARYAAWREKLIAVTAAGAAASGAAAAAGGSK
jgi:secreted Zn-dependent insulinase-like peptidase